MKIFYQHRRITMALFLCTAAALCGAAGASAADPQKVAIIPFKMNAEKDLSFLRDGIVDMLTSRLTWSDKVAVINRQKTAEKAASVKGPLTEAQARQRYGGDRECRRAQGCESRQ